MADQVVHGAGGAEGSDLAVEQGSSIEPFIIKRVCEPLLEWVPRSVHPNTISLLNHLVSWVVVWLAIFSSRLGPVGRPAVLVLVGAGVFATMVLDCLDGMQARRTNRCSKLGELLDHWLDAIHVPLTSIAVVMALELPPWAIAAIVIPAAGCYNAQLVLYHHRGVFVQPPASGVDAQFAASVLFFLMAAAFALVPPDTAWLEWAIVGAVWLAIVLQLRLNLFFYVRLKGLVVHHLKFVLASAAFAALYLVGAIDAIAFVLAATFVSFRLTGSYVLSTIVGRRYGGMDYGIFVGIALIALTLHERVALAAPWLVEPVALLGRSFLPAAALPYLVFAYLVGRNLLDLRAHYHELKPGAVAS